MIIWKILLSCLDGYWEMFGAIMRQWGVLYTPPLSWLVWSGPANWTSIEHELGGSEGDLKIWGVIGLKGCRQFLLKNSWLCMMLQHPSKQCWPLTTSKTPHYSLKPVIPFLSIHMTPTLCTFFNTILFIKVSKHPCNAHAISLYPLRHN